MLKKLLLFLCLIPLGFAIHAQNIELIGNQIPIMGNGNNIANTADGTLLSDTSIGKSSEQAFTIVNIDTRDVFVQSILIDNQEFSVEGRVRRINRGRSADFSILFEPTSSGLKTTIMTITVRVRGIMRVYRYNINALANENGEYEGLMISQYYENADNDYIEIINHSTKATSGKPYYLAVFKRNDNLNDAPRSRNIIEFRKLEAGEVRLYDNFRLRGNEVIVISTSKGKNCYRDRVDVLGVQNELWGQAVSMSKGACASEAAHYIFDKKNWIYLELTEVDEAIEEQNLFLGTYQIGTIVWDGTQWTSNALPDRTRSVIIDGAYSGGIGNIEACDLVVNDDLDFDNESVRSVVLYGDLAINGNFRIGDKESLVMYDDDAMVTGNITKIERSTFRNNPHDFTYWSSPVEGALLSDVFAGVSSSRLYYFDQSNTDTSDPNHPDFWSTWVLANGSMVSGRGYATEGLSGTTGIHEITFSGTPNNGVVLTSIHQHDDADLNNDFNMIGNPYPSAIDIEAFFDQNLEWIDPTVYLWTHTTAVSESTGDFSFDDYATYNYTGGTGVGDGPAPTNNIGSSQGFFVRAIKTGAVSFTNSMRLKDANDQFFKASKIKNRSDISEKDRVWLNMTTDQGGFNQLLIGFIEGASENIDPGYDALKFEGSNKISFYSVVDSEKMAIQGLGRFESENEIILGFDTKVEHRTYEIAIAKLEGVLRDVEIILLDQLTGVEHDLKESSYTFEQAEKGQFPNRFSIRFVQHVKEPIEIAEPIVKGLQVFNRGDVFSIASAKKIKTVRIFDIMGKMIFENHPHESNFDIFEPKGRKGQLLLMQIEHADQSSLVKKVYKQ